MTFVKVGAHPGAIPPAQHLVGAAAGKGGKDLHQQIAGEGVADHHVGAAGEEVIAPEDAAAITADRLGKLYRITLSSQILEDALNLPRPLHIEDTQPGPGHPHGLCHGDAGDGV